MKKKKKRILFAGFSDSESKELRAATAHSDGHWDSHFVADAPAALTMLTEHKFDALVANMAMTGKNGAELLHEARELHPHTLGFIVGEVTDQSLIIDCIGGTHQFIRRPYQPVKLMTSLKRGLRLDNWLVTDDLRKLVPKLRRLPSLPSTYFNLLKEVESASATTQGIGSVIARDPVATGRLLQMTNSAAFSLVQKVTDPVHAVTLLGIETVKSLVMSLQIFSQTDMARGAGLSLEILWEHSLLVAKFARQITLKQTNDPRLAGDAFTAGLLHDVGRIVLASNLPKEYAEIIAAAREHSRPLHEEETAVLRVNHAEIGAYLLGMWGLPAEIVEATGGHHAPGQTVYATEFSLLAAVHAANVFAHEAGGQTDGLALPELDLEYFRMIMMEDQLPAWRECCTGEQPAAPVKIAVTGAPVVEKVVEATAPAAEKAEAAPVQVKALALESPMPAVEPLLPPLIKPAPPLSEAATRFVYGLAIAIPVLLAIGGFTAWHFHGKKTDAPETDVVLTDQAASTPTVASSSAATETVAKKSPSPLDSMAMPAPSPRKPAGAFDKIRVQGIFYRAASPLAIINGKTAGIGDSINGIEVADIGQHSVTLSLNGEQKVFNFH
jgi:HD-like signal output (HDOD) protein